MPAFESLRLPTATVRWRLDGPESPDLDLVVALLCAAGVGAEVIAPARAYRLNGDAGLLGSLAAQLNEIPGFRLDYEQPPSDRVSVTTVLAAPRQYRRANVVHGRDASPLIARAIDLGLAVESAGVMRWRITGPTSMQAAWLAKAQMVPTTDVLARWGLDGADTVAAEDAALPLVSVVLPTRRTQTDFIQRDENGDLLRVVQTEATVQ